MTDFEREMGWAKTAPIGVLLKDFWKELDFQSKRKFFSSLCSLIHHIPGQSLPDLPVKLWPSSEALGVYNFFWDLFDLTGNWRLRNSVEKQKPKYKTYFEYLDEIEAKKNYRYMALRK